MLKPIAVVTLLATHWLTAASAFAQANDALAPPPAADSAAPTAPVAAPAAPAAPLEITSEQTRDKILPKAPEPDPEQLEKVRKLYETAREALGSEHVLLTAAAYVGKKPKLSSESKEPTLQGGVAGVISLPLFGAGGGHGPDWYPVLQTEAATKAFERFENEVKQYVALADNLDVAKSDPRAVLRALEEAALTLLDQVTDDDPDLWRLARATKLCVEGIGSLRNQVRIGLASKAQPGATESALQVESAPELDEVSALSADEPSDKSLEAVVTKCGAMVNAVGTIKSDDVNQQIAALTALLRTYWQALKKEGDAAALARHAFLIGPAVGIPVTENPGKVVLTGALMEVGKSHFRLGITAGLQFRYSALEETPGWFAGLSLSGELGDDLFHFLNGGLQAARSLSPVN